MLGHANMAGVSCCRRASGLVCAASRLRPPGSKGLTTGQVLQVKVRYNVNDANELVAATRSSKDPAKLQKISDQLATLAMQWQPSQRVASQQVASQQVLDVLKDILPVLSKFR